MGDPAGIGPEIVLKGVADPRVTAVCEPVLYGPHTAAERDRFTLGVLSAEAGRVAYEAVEQAVADAMAGRLDAITTGPINKAALALAGFAWRGHTELLAHLTGARDVAMMFHSPRLRVVLATVHVPLSAVPRLLTQARVETTLTLAASALPRFGVATPRLALAGLNLLVASQFSEDSSAVISIWAARRIDRCMPLQLRTTAEGSRPASISCCSS